LTAVKAGGMARTIGIGSNDIYHWRAAAGQRQAQGPAARWCFAAAGKDVMAGADPATLMWTAACEMIDRAERLHRQFFLPMAAPMGDLVWEPPVDIIATDSEILVTVALPGVDRDAVQVTVDDDGISVLGFRPGTIPRGSLVHRLEIPYGKFQRRIAFPGARRRLGQSDLANGCLMLKFSNQPFAEGRIDA
jgi:HSP20 family molecular chaperone IbpA